MAVFRNLHNGMSLRDLRNVIRYNSNDKKGLNTANNPRLIDVISNVDYCSNVNDKNEYKNFIENFISTVDSNFSLRKNQRQKYLYEHSVISFDHEDDEKLGIKKATELAIEMYKEYDANFEDTPYLIYPQTDSNKLHFHFVKSYHDEEGNYNKQADFKLKMNKAAQEIERKNDLKLTGRNDPSNYIWKTSKNGKKTKKYFPQSNKNDEKTAKNKALDLEIKIDKNGNIEYFKKVNKSIENHHAKIKQLNDDKNSIKAKEADEILKRKNEISNLKKPIKYGFFQKLLTNDEDLDKAEISSNIKKNNSEIDQIKDSIKPKILKINKKNSLINNSLNNQKTKLKKINQLISDDNNLIDIHKSKTDKSNTFKDVINNAYRHSKTAETFLKTLNEHNIEACISFRENGQGGISFNSLNSNISLAGGKVNSYLTFGKIKKNDPDLFNLLSGIDALDEITFDNKNTVNNVLNVGEINKNYSQKINTDGSTSIFFSKKNSDKYPHNFNLKINVDKSKISFGQNSNKHDFKIAYTLAKQSGWTGAKSDNKELIESSMTIAYSENKDDLFFFTTNEPTLELSKLKEIVVDDLLSKDNLIKLYDNDIICKKDKKEALVFIKNQLSNYGEDLTVINSLINSGNSLQDCLKATEKIKKEHDIEVQNKKKVISENEPAFKEKVKTEKTNHNKSVSKYKITNKRI
jgi:hypothetical protein